MKYLANAAVVAWMAVVGASGAWLLFATPPTDDLKMRRVPDNPVAAFVAELLAAVL